MLLEHAFYAVQSCTSNNLPISLTCTDLFCVLSLLASLGESVPFFHSTFCYLLIQLYYHTSHCIHLSDYFHDV